MVIITQVWIAVFLGLLQLLGSFYHFASAINTGDSHQPEPIMARGGDLWL